MTLRSKVILLAVLAGSLLLSPAHGAARPRPATRQLLADTSPTQEELARFNVTVAEFLEFRDRPRTVYNGEQGPVVALVSCPSGCRTIYDRWSVCTRFTKWWACDAPNDVFACCDGALETWVYCYNTVRDCPVKSTRCDCSCPSGTERKVTAVIKATPISSPSDGSVGSTGSKASFTGYAANSSPVEQSTTMSATVTRTTQATLTWQEADKKGWKVDTKVSMKVSSPGKLVEGGVEVTAGYNGEITTTDGKSDATTETNTLTTTVTTKVPKYCNLTSSGTIDTFTEQWSQQYEVELEWSCGEPRTTTERWTADIKASGIITSNSRTSVEWGPCLPLQRPIIYDQPTAACSTNPRCAELGMREGDCCPMITPENGAKFLECCAQAKAHMGQCPPEKYQSPEDAICPCRTGEYDKCCPNPSTMMAQIAALKSSPSPSPQLDNETSTSPLPSPAQPGASPLPSPAQPAASPAPVADPSPMPSPEASPLPSPPQPAASPSLQPSPDPLPSPAEPAASPLPQPSPEQSPIPSPVPGPSADDPTDDSNQSPGQQLQDEIRGIVTRG